MNHNGIKFLTGFLLLLTSCSCKKIEDTTTKVSAPLRNYVITARLDNKQAGTDSKATGIFKGTYSEKTKVMAYTLTFESISPTLIRIDKGAKGSAGTQVAEIPRPASQVYTSPTANERKLTSLEERDLLKGLWYISIQSAAFKPYEIRGLVTIKQS